MGIAAGDLNDDGRCDLVVTNFYNRCDVAFQREPGLALRYRDATSRAGLASATQSVLGFGVALADLDGDGRLDVIQTNGHVLDRDRLGTPFAMRPTVLRNAEAGFKDASAQAGNWFRRPILGRGLAVGDLDGDGRPDVLASALDAPAALIHNRCETARFLSLDVVNRFGQAAVGARVRVVGWRPMPNGQPCGRRQLSGGLTAAIVVWPRPGAGRRADRSRLAVGRDGVLDRACESRLRTIANQARDRPAHGFSVVPVDTHRSAGVSVSVASLGHGFQREDCTPMSNQPGPVDHTLQCMEIWGGIEPVERTVSTPGLDLWVFSQPFQGEQQGGDVYYVTLCGGGVITRIVVADVSGHGSSVAEFSLFLRALLRKNINQKSQKRVVERLNRQFSAMADMRRFATALVVTYLASHDRLSICNAGHPNPLFYRAIDGRWSFLSQPDREHDRGRAHNLPLGLDDQTNYQTFDVDLGRGDLVVFYTDALSEAADPSGKLLGELGLLEAARGLGLPGQRPVTIGPALLESVARHRHCQSAADDVTIVVLHHNASASPRLSIAQKADVYAKVFGLKAV